MSAAFRRRLLGTTLPVAGCCQPTLNTTTATVAPQLTGDEILAACKVLMDEIMPGGVRPRWVGGGMPGLQIEVNAEMPNGWFGLRQPNEAVPYAGPLPIASFQIFYRGGDIVRLSPVDAERFARGMKRRGGGRAG